MATEKASESLATEDNRGKYSLLIAENIIPTYVFIIAKPAVYKPTSSKPPSLPIKIRIIYVVPVVNNALKEIKNQVLALHNLRKKSPLS